LIWAERDPWADAAAVSGDGASEHAFIEQYLELADIALKVWNGVSGSD
jgi:hypothetical protein